VLGTMRYPFREIRRGTLGIPVGRKKDWLKLATVLDYRDTRTH
jgi:hypothetical protein